jgi:hypothetical protein
MASKEVAYHLNAIIKKEWPDLQCSGIYPFILEVNDCAQIQFRLAGDVFVGADLLSVPAYEQSVRLLRQMILCRLETMRAAIDKQIEILGK